MTGPVALEVFGGGGGAVYGLLRAGFARVIVIDNADHARTLGTLAAKAAAEGLGAVEFHQMDWKAGVDRFGPEADLCSGGPPCQWGSQMSACRPGLDATYPNLIGPFRDAVLPLGVPYWIEQPDTRRARAVMRADVKLCGQHFGLTGVTAGGARLGLQRHRIFETDTPVTGPGPCRHTLPRLPVYGHGAPGNFPPELKGPGMEEAMRQGMDCWWMPRRPLAESIPWLYAWYLACQILAADPRLARWGLGAGWEEIATGAAEVQLL